jgi:hypothetical protein
VSAYCPLIDGDDDAATEDTMMTTTTIPTEIRNLAADMADDHCHAVLAAGSEPTAADAETFDGIVYELRMALRSAISEWIADREASLLAEAIAHIDAEECEYKTETANGPVFGLGGFVYRDDATRKQYRVTRGAMLMLGRMLERREADAYSHWCSCTFADEVIEQDEDETED